MLDDDGLRDFWRVYEPSYDAIRATAMQAASAHPVFARVIAATTPEMMAADNATSRVRMGRAIDGDWREYDTELRTRGSTYAKLGITFADWYDLVGMIQRGIVPLLVGAYGAEPARLTAALQGMQAFADRTMVIIAEAYHDAQQELVGEQRALAERNEERYQMLFDNGPVPMWVYDVETLRFLTVNRAAVEQYGYTEAEFLSMTIEDIRHPDDLPRLREETLRAKSIRAMTNLGEWRHRRKDGTSFDVELRLEQFIFIGRRAHLIVATDVTERRRAARALEQSEERYRSVVAATTAVVWTTDADGRFVVAQPSWQAYTGQSWEQYRDVGWIEAVHPDDRERVSAAWAKAQATRTLYEAEARLWHAPSGQHRYFVARAVPMLNPDGTAREWIGTVTDVDDEKKAEEPGRFFTLSLEMLCIAGVDGYFKRLNPAFDVLGYTVEELMQRPFVDYVHPDDRAATLAEVEKLSRGQQTIQFENRYRCKDGSYRYLNWKSAADPSGTIYAAARDITEEKRIEAERAELNRLLVVRNEELTRASRAKSDFLAMMSHELRTPLNSIIGFSEVLLDGKFGSLTDKQSRYLGNVLQSGRHLLGLINDLLDLSKIEAGRLEVVRQPCAARSLVADAMVTLQPLADARKVTLAVDPLGSPPIPPVVADAARFKQVLYNLLSNAIKFTPAEGRVGVHCALAPVAGFVRIAVTDSGLGISADDLERLYQPFTQLANAKDRGGTGLGLALTKQLVELMGGRIGIDSAVGRGSTFFFDLPIHAAAGAVDDRPLVAVSAAPLALVVDDDAAARELLAMSLQEAGYRVVGVGSGEEALAQARRLRPDVITLDVFLPTIDGWDALRLLKSDRETAHIPVVMVTISSDRAKAFSLGAVEHLIKPVGRDALLEAMARRSFTTKVKTAAVEVLAIDDDLRQLELFRATLEPQGFRVRTASSGRAGLAAAQSGTVDLVLLDLVMPDLSGVEVVSALRSDVRTRAVPILLVTAHELTEADRARLNGDVAAIIAKGATRMEDLVQEIRRVVRQQPKA
ncbi:MAG: hybrid sensor histidine kinase/response regulator [Myxococcales bacterium]|nr:hybrid sensor histidine kinase/response regulator [Myxococcales bacterium]